MKSFNKPIISCYDNGRDITILYRENGEKRKEILKNQFWYFAIRKRDGDRIIDEIKKIKKIKIKQIGNYYKIYLTEKWERIEILRLKTFFENRTVEVLEFDCALSKKYMIDNALQIDTQQKIAFFDIEVDDSNLGIEIGRDRIVSWALCDKDSGEITFNHSFDEKQLLNDFLRQIKKYDVICGWNSKGFDLPYIKARTLKHNIKYNWHEIAEFDLMNRFVMLFRKYMSYINLAGFSLDEVSRTFLDDRKIKIDPISYLEKNDLKKLEEYNKKDVELLYKLDKKLNVLDLVIKECNWTGTLLKYFSVGELLDNYILREARKNKMFFPTKRQPTEEKLLIAGGYVMAPKKGLHKNVKVLDFKSLYPTIIVSFNISHDTILDSQEENSIITTNGYRYSKRKGIYADLVKYLLEARKEYKEKMLKVEYDSMEYHDYEATQELIKELTNAMYGICAEPTSRFFDKRIAESITLTGQYIIKNVIELLEKDNHTVVYSDTDSIFLLVEEGDKLEEIIKKTEKELKENLIKEFNLDSSKYIISLKYEKTYDPIVFVDKKRYSGKIVEADGKKMNKIYPRGLENRRKDSIVYTRKKIDELLEYLLAEEKQLDFFIEWVKTEKEKFFISDISIDDLKITKKISKQMSKYKSELPHVRLAKEMIKEKKILEFSGGKRTWGQKIEYIVIGTRKKKQYKQVEVVQADQYEKGWDRSYYWNVYVFKVLKRILDSVFPEHDWNQYIDKGREKIITKTLYEERNKRENNTNNN